MSSSGAFKDSWSDSTSLDDGTLEWTNTLTGKLNRKGTKITGNYRNVEVVRGRDGSVMETCDSGPLRFSATR